MKKYFDLIQTGPEVDITIFGDITSWPYLQSDVSSYGLAQQISNLPDEVSNINIHINSYGGEVAEGLAIYNTLKNSKAHVTTIVDGFACSAASIIFMAGNDRIMNNVSLIMIHNASTSSSGNSDQLRKDADDLDIMNAQIIKSYLTSVNIAEDEVKALMDNETWITPETALKDGFATEIKNDDSQTNPSNSARVLVFNKMTSCENAESAKPVTKEEIVQLIKDNVDAIQKKELPSKEKNTEVETTKSDKKTSDKLDAFLYALQSNSNN